jgi:NDP-sugar pyrophosphorylase family protein
MSPTLVVLAAGMGSRYGGLKQMDPIGPAGETIIDYSIHDALRAGFGSLVFVIRRDIEQPFRENVGARFERHLTVEYVFQELDRLPAGFSVPSNRTRPWGTGHAILMAADAISGPFAVINADDFYGANSFRLLAEHLRSGGGDYAMVGFVLRNTLSSFGSVARGKCEVSVAGYLESVTELTGIEPEGQGAKFTHVSGKTQTLSGDEIVSMNLWGFTPELFPQLQDEWSAFLKQNGRDKNSEFYIPTVVNALINMDRAHLKVLRTPDSWFGVTYREDRPHVMEGIRRLIARGDYPEKLWS